MGEWRRFEVPGSFSLWMPEGSRHYWDDDGATFCVTLPTSEVTEVLLSYYPFKKKGRPKNLLDDNVRTFVTRCIFKDRRAPRGYVHRTTWDKGRRLYVSHAVVDDQCRWVVRACCQESRADFWLMHWNGDPADVERLVLPLFESFRPIFAPDPMSDEAFDKEVGEVADTVSRVLKDGEYRFHNTTVYMSYPDKLEIHALLPQKREESSDIYDVIYEFGRHLGASAPIPQAAYIAQPTEWYDGGSCIFVSGCTPFDRKNGCKLPVERSDEGIIRVTGKELLSCRKVRFNGRTYAGQFMKGFLEAVGGPDRSPTSP